MVIDTHDLVINVWYFFQVEKDRQLVLHFFVVKLALDQFHSLEHQAVQSSEYGAEVSLLFISCSIDSIN